MDTFYDYDEKLRKDVVSYIEDNDMSCAEFARQINCSDSTITKFVRGKYKLGRNIKRKILRKIDMSVDVEEENDLYNFKELTNSDKLNMINMVMNETISKLENELENYKKILYDLEWQRDKLHNLLKGL